MGNSYGRKCGESSWLLLVPDVGEKKLWYMTRAAVSNRSAMNRFPGWLSIGRQSFCCTFAGRGDNTVAVWFHVTKLALAVELVTFVCWRNDVLILSYERRVLIYSEASVKLDCVWGLKNIVLIKQCRKSLNAKKNKTITINLLNLTGKSFDNPHTTRRVTMSC